MAGITKKTIQIVPPKATDRVLDNLVDFGPEAESSNAVSKRIRQVIKKLEEMSVRIDRLNSRM